MCVHKDRLTDVHGDRSADRRKCQETGHAPTHSLAFSGWLIFTQVFVQQEPPVGWVVADWIGVLFCLLFKGMCMACGCFREAAAAAAVSFGDSPTPHRGAAAGAIHAAAPRSEQDRQAKQRKLRTSHPAPIIMAPVCRRLGATPSATLCLPPSLCVNTAARGLCLYVMESDAILVNTGHKSDFTKCIKNRICDRSAFVTGRDTTVTP